MTFGKKILLGEIAHVTSGYSFKSEEFMDSGVPVIKINNIRDGFIDISDAQCVDEKYLELEERHHIKDGDVLISLTGSHITQPGSVVGRIARYTNKQIALLNQRAGKFSILDENNCDKQFLFYLLSTSNYRRSLALLAHGAASQANISPRDVEKIEIELPPLPTQRRIADILSAYDDLIENNTRRIRILEQMAQAIYQEWFGKVDAKAESLPEGWEEKTLGDIAQEVRRNINPNEIDPETPYLGLEHLPRKSIALSEWDKAGDVQSTKLAFKKGEILFGKIRPYFHKVGVAPLDGVASSDTIIIAPKSPEYFGLALSYVFSEEFVNYATQTSQGTKMPRANWDVLVKYPVLIPPKPLLEQFNQTINDFVDLIQNLLIRNRNLRQTRDLLLPRLVSGEVIIG